MITIADRVKTLLDEAGAAVWYFYPQSWLSLPAVSWRESRNRELHQADGRERLAELEYSVDVWAKSPEQARAIADRIDAILTGIRLRRDYAEDLYDAGMHRRSLRYRCVADAAGNIYQ